MQLIPFVIDKQNFCWEWEFSLLGILPFVSPAFFMRREDQAYIDGHDLSIQLLILLAKRELRNTEKY
ncbi:hypothetical protein NXS08_05165 [Gleimia sp. 6138-11-ORH1]|uniref:hypothetical protein n=1 Tax=Gleimia sp. 6138-11-ORH1 TaxID=2973937 RepID=UPI0021674551|nr:hypothetical protein [Gleimia sp. 6138-11-ORH1]MCS4484866.1 hypothetical protein [Gleimia sp. 6138-11-ORH1]